MIESFIQRLATEAGGVHPHTAEIRQQVDPDDIGNRLHCNLLLIFSDDFIQVEISPDALLIQ